MYSIILVLYIFRSVHRSANPLPPPRRTPPLHTQHRTTDFRLAASTALFTPIGLEPLPAQHAGRSPCRAHDCRLVPINWALNLIGLAHIAPFHVGPRNRATLSIQLDIPFPRVAHTHDAPGFEGEREPPLLPLPAPHTHCPGEGHTYRRPCPSTGEGHGVDVDCRLLLRADPCNLVLLFIQLDIPHRPE
jgi:hypothetical protein